MSNVFGVKGLKRLKKDIKFKNKDVKRNADFVTKTRLRRIDVLIAKAKRSKDGKVRVKQDILKTNKTIEKLGSIKMGKVRKR